jgi:hypothetical protein
MIYTVPWAPVVALATVLLLFMVVPLVAFAALALMLVALVLATAAALVTAAIVVPPLVVAAVKDRLRRLSVAVPRLAVGVRRPTMLGGARLGRPR